MKSAKKLKSEETIEMGVVKIKLPEVIWDYLDEVSNELGVSVDKLCELVIKTKIEKYQ